MTNKDFNEFLEETLTTIDSTLSKKAECYSTTTSRLHNFEMAAKRDNITPQKALRGMQLKHRQAIADFLNRPLPETPYNEWQEKIIDTISYYILLLAMVKEATDKHASNRSLHKDDYCSNCMTPNGSPKIGKAIPASTWGNSFICKSCGRLLGGINNE